MYLEREEGGRGQADTYLVGIAAEDVEWETWPQIQEVF